MAIDKQVILITGASKGIGKALALHYADLGFRVIGCSRIEAEFKIPNFEHVTLDVADEKKVLQLFEGIRLKYGRLDALINNAGKASMNHICLTSIKTVQQIISTNFTGTFLFCREAAKLMSKNNFGRIVNLSTVAVPLRLSGEAIYAASKAAVVMLTEILAFELAPFGITVNALGPGPVDTDLIKGVPQEKIDAIINQQAIKRLTEYRDIINVISFLLKPESDFITGQTIYLGGINR